MQGDGSFDAGVIENEQLIPCEESANKDKSRIDVHTLFSCQLESVYWDVFVVNCKQINTFKLNKLGHDKENGAFINSNLYKDQIIKYKKEFITNKMF